MKVLQVIDRLAVGGAEKVFVSLTNNLLSAGVTVTALLFDTGYELEKDLNVEVIDLKRKNKFSIKTLYRTHRICSSHDIVHTHLRHVHAYVKLVQVLFGGDYKLILHDHSGVSEKVPFRLKGIFKPTYYIGVYKQQVDWAISKLNIAASKVFLLNNIISDSTVVYQEANGNSVMMVSNIRSVKNLEFAIALTRNLNKKLTIYGNIVDEEYYQELQHLMGGEQDVEIVTGITDFSEIYSKHSMAIHTSKQETGPIVLLEYMMAGLPFVAYKTGSVASLMSDDIGECFADSFDMNEWIQKVEQVDRSKEQLEKLRELCMRYYNPEQITKKCLQIYESVGS